jgi:lysophospholipase L1-like esterase
LLALLNEVKSRGTAAGKLPTVIVTTYYDPFPPSNSTTCDDLSLPLGFGIDASEAAWLRQKLLQMNQIISQSGAAYPNVKVVDLANVLSGHTLCSSDPWVYGISIWYDDLGNPAPFHPTPAGHQAIANLIIPVVNGL